MVFDLYRYLMNMTSCQKRNYQKNSNTFKIKSFNNEGNTSTGINYFAFCVNFKLQP